jgi:hypothetical protein
MLSIYHKELLCQIGIKTASAPPEEPLMDGFTAEVKLCQTGHYLVIMIHADRTLIYVGVYIS